MLVAKAPPLIPSLALPGRGEGLTEDHFRALFQYLYVEAHWYARLPEGAVRVTFHPHHFAHAFFKESARGAPRTIWQPRRAERLLWIGYTLENPTEVHQVNSSRFDFFCRLSDREAPWYLVVIDQRGNETANFVTAYPLDHREAANSRKTGVLLSSRTQQGRPEGRPCSNTMTRLSERPVGAASLGCT